jgi:hypothetical protein
MAAYKINLINLDIEIQMNFLKSYFTDPNNIQIPEKGIGVSAATTTRNPPN